MILIIINVLTPTKLVKFPFAARACLAKRSKKLALTVLTIKYLSQLAGNKSHPVHCVKAICYKELSASVVRGCGFTTPSFPHSGFEGE
jgi:hypothetical protein